MVDKVTSFQRHKAEQRTDVRDALAEVTAKATLGDVRSAVCIYIEDNGEVKAVVAHEYSDADQIIAALERVKFSILKD